MYKQKTDEYIFPWKINIHAKPAKKMFEQKIAASSMCSVVF